MKEKTLLIVLICLFFISCVSVSAVKLGTVTERPPIPADEVIVYRTADQVPFEYEEIALLTAKGEAGWTDEEDMFNAMRKKAGKLGANAIILDAISEPSAGAKIAGAVLGTGAERKGKAVAIFVHKDKSIEKKEG